MENCIQAAIKFFDSPVCAGLTFGELRNLLNGVLELTLAELGNVTQLVDVAKGDRYKNRVLDRFTYKCSFRLWWKVLSQILSCILAQVLQNFLLNGYPTP